MTTIHKKKINENITGSVFALVAGVTTAAVAVAGIVVATSRVLKNKKIRGKIEKTLTSVKNQTTDYVKAIRDDLNTKEDIDAANRIVIHAKKVVKKAYKEGEAYGNN
jgi:uncharacterized membrane protein